MSKKRVNRAKRQRERHRRASGPARPAKSASQGASTSGSPYQKIAARLARFERASTVAALAGLLTLPSQQAHTLRIEFLVHLAVAHCVGTRIARMSDVKRWVDRDVNNTQIASMEDPPDDVFVGNIISAGGNYRILTGLWESADTNAQILLNAALHMLAGSADEILIFAPILGLLQLSEEMHRRSNLSRWAYASEADLAAPTLDVRMDLSELSNRVRFTTEDLQRLGIIPEQLLPWVLSAALYADVSGEVTVDGRLTRRPLITDGDTFLLAMPTAVSVAIRHGVVRACHATGRGDALYATLQRLNQNVLATHVLPRLSARRDDHAATLRRAVVRPAVASSWFEAAQQFDSDKIAVVVSLVDSFADHSAMSLLDEMQLAFDVEELVAHITTLPQAGWAEGTRGLIVVTFGGAGRSIALPHVELPDGWHCIALSWADLSMYAEKDDASLLQLYALEESATAFTSRGARAICIGGLLNNLSFWERNDFSFPTQDSDYPPPAGTMLMITSDYQRPLRSRERVSHDQHAVRHWLGTGFIAVQRLAAHAFFPSMDQRPIYVPADLVTTSGELQGVYESDSCLVWVTTAPAGVGSASFGFLFELWHALLSWLDRIMTRVVDTDAGSRHRTGALRIHLGLEADERWRTMPDLAGSAGAPPRCREEDGGTQLRIDIPYEFTALLRQTSNVAEHALVEEIVRWLLSARADGALAETGQQPLESAQARTAAFVQRIMPNESTRMVHAIRPTSAADQISALTPKRRQETRFVDNASKALWSRGLAWSVLDRTQPVPSLVDFVQAKMATTGDTGSVRIVDKGLVCVGADACTALCNEMVDGIWDRLRSVLTACDGPSMVRRLLEDNEAILADREHWSRTARSISALYGETDDIIRITASREAERARAAVASRVLIEMAVCTCHESTSRLASRTDTDWAVAGVDRLVNLASASDAIRSGLAAAELRIGKDGSVLMDLSDTEALTTPFALEQNVALHRAGVASYDRYYEVNEQRPPGQQATLHESLTSAFGDAFLTAFAIEFGLSADDAVRGVHALLAYASAERSLVVMATRGTLAKMLATDAGFTDVAIQAFANTFFLEGRPRWDSAPAGYLNRDWHPWVFRRRLALTVRPLVAFGHTPDSPVLYGVRQLELSLQYLFDNAGDAYLPHDFFATQAMRAFHGGTVNRLGHAFNDDVGRLLTTAGWVVRTEVQMTQLGASAALGDVDVIAWQPDDARLLLIECKRLQPAKTIGEIARQLSEFSGAHGDRLGKHMARYEWITEHLGETLRAVGCTRNHLHVYPLLVTNRTVPMKFREGLPLPTQQIVRADQLVEHLGQSVVLP